MTRRAERLIAMGALAFVACGYRPVHDGRKGGGWCVDAGPEPAVDPDATPAVVFGARDALSRDGRLASCSNGRRFVVQVLSVSWEPAAIVSYDLVTARSTRVVVVASAHTEGRGATDLGLVEAQSLVAVGDGPQSEQQARSTAVMAAGRKAGAALARRLLGVPAPTPIL